MFEMIKTSIITYSQMVQYVLAKSLLWKQNICLSTEKYSMNRVMVGC